MTPRSLTLRREWVHGWLLLTPALVLLFAFTHIPAVTTIWDSFFSNPRAGGARRNSSACATTRPCWPTTPSGRCCPTACGTRR